MGHSAPRRADDQRTHRGSRTRIATALVLLIVGIAAISWVVYLAARRVPRTPPDAVATTDRAASQTPGARPSTPAGSAAPPAGGGQADRPASPPTLPAAPPSSASAEESSSVAGKASAEPGVPPKPPSGGFELAALVPIEVEADESGRTAWRRSVKLGGRVYDRAVCLTPAEDQGVAQIAFRVGARFVQLRGVAGLADAAPPGAARERPQAVFRVYGDGNLLWDSGLLEGRGEHRAFECSVAGVDILTFVAESQSPAAVSELAWGDLRLFPDAERGAPQASAVPKTP